MPIVRCESCGSVTYIAALISLAGDAIGKRIHWCRCASITLGSIGAASSRSVINARSRIKATAVAEAEPFKTRQHPL
jgi:hypothetical protein